MCLITESGISFVVDPSEGDNTSFNTRPLILVNAFFSQGDNLILSKFLLTFENVIFYMRTSCHTTTEISEREVYGHANPERDPTWRLVLGVLPLKILNFFYLMYIRRVVCDSGILDTC